uniref:hypothetical protein n=1 Tax=Nonomuraea sp. CA-251285 TaxID=3240002 RepID=UPI003F491837
MNEQQTAGIEMARRWPVTATRIILIPGTNQANSWAVLVAAYDEMEAQRLLRLVALDVSDGDRKKAEALIARTLAAVADPKP